MQGAGAGIRAPRQRVTLPLIKVLRMFSTELSTGLVVLALLLLLLAMACFAHAMAMYKKVSAWGQYIVEQNKRSVTLRRMAEVEATLTELLDSYESLLTSHKKLRSRITMRENRAKPANGIDSTSVPADETAKAAYKAELRKKLRAEGKL